MSRFISLSSTTRIQVIWTSFESCGQRSQRVGKGLAEWSKHGRGPAIGHVDRRDHSAEQLANFCASAVSMPAPAIFGGRDIIAMLEHLAWRPSPGRTTPCSDGSQVCQRQRPPSPLADHDRSSFPLPCCADHAGRQVPDGRARRSPVQHQRVLFAPRRSKLDPIAPREPAPMASRQAPNSVADDVAARGCTGILPASIRE